MDVERILQALARRGITRRWFLVGAAAGGGALAGAAFLSGCNKTSTGPELIDKDALARYTRERYDDLFAAASNPGSPVVLKNGNEVIGTVVFQEKGGKFSYRHPVLIRRDGEKAHIGVGIDGFHPSIILAGEDGEPLEVDGRKLKLPISQNTVNRALGKPQVSAEEEAAALSTPAEWLELGIKVFAIALGIWLGVKIIGFVASVIAFLAFNALVIGLLIAAIAVIALVLDYFGIEITLDSVRDFFSRAVQEIRNFLENLSEYEIPA